MAMPASVHFHCGASRAGADASFGRPVDAVVAPVTLEVSDHIWMLSFAPVLAHMALAAV